MAGNPLDHPVDDNPAIDVPGKLRAEAKKRRAAGEYRVAKDMEDEAKRVELKRKFAKGTPGQRAVIQRMHERENQMDWKAAGVILGIGLSSLLISGVIYRALGKRK